MGASIRISGEGDLEELRARLQAARDHARTQLRQLLDDPNLMDRLKFERLGCDPIDISDAQNLAEQIDQQATYETAATALGVLLARHPGRIWDLAPGAHGSGPDIQSTDGQVVAEVFAAVHPLNNGKLRKDLDKLARSSAPHRYVFFRSPQVPPSERIENGINVVALPEYGR